MAKIEDCVFCDRPSLGWRTIRSEELFTSFVSRPWFRSGQCLVVPNRHLVNPSELSPEGGTANMGELGRLSLKLDKGSGTGIMQKYQPLQAENGIKVNHLHFHVFPRIEDETELFPVPQPNTFDWFVTPSADEVIAVAEALR